LGRICFRPLRAPLLRVAVVCFAGVGLIAQQGPIEPGSQTVARPRPAAQGQSSSSTSGQTGAKTPARQVPFKPDSTPAASQDETPLFRSDVRLVRMLATARDSHGALAGHLTRDDFQVADSGVMQEIAIFEPTTERPLSVSILIDCSRSTQREHRTELDAVRTFARSLFQQGNEKDAATLYSFNADVTLEAAWTRSAERIERALNRLQSEGATALYDAIYFAAQDVRARDGRHVIVIVSDGGNTFGKTTYLQALEAAHGADAVIYSVIIVPVVEEPGRNTGGEHALTSLCNSTGGRTFSPGTTREMDSAFSDILRDLRTQYLIGYYPHGVPAARDRFHEVKLSVRAPGYTVTSRSGYFEPAPSSGFRKVTK